MKKVLKIALMAIAYLALFIMGAWSGAIHPMFYAYIGVAILAMRLAERAMNHSLR